MKKIKKLENDTISKQLTLEQVSPSSPGFLFKPTLVGGRGGGGGVAEKEERETPSSSALPPTASVGEFPESLFILSYARSL